MKIYQIIIILFLPQMPHNSFWPNVKENKSNSISPLIKIICSSLIQIKKKKKKKKKKKPNLRKYANIMTD